MIKSNHNPSLPFIINNWQGNPLTNLGLYTNLDGDNIRGFKELLKWMSGPRPLTKLKKNQQFPLSFNKITELSKKTNHSIIPLGHASFIIEINYKRILIDPVIDVNILLKRHSPIPIDIHKILDLDYILISHNHRDHLDKSSIQKICKNNPKAIILTALGIEKQLRSWNISNIIQEAGWFQQYETKQEIDIIFLPAKHWSRRWIRDTNTSLWGSFIIRSNEQNKCIYYGGDSGYGMHFNQIGELFDIDLALLGVGAYEPQWFMKPYHTGPSDAIEAFKGLKAKKWMPIHYGTFDLSDEPIYYPEYILKTKHQNELQNIVWMQIGHYIEF